MDNLYEKAKEGGYDFERISHLASVGDRDRALVLDPTFFQALGKACGWAERICFDCGSDMSSTIAPNKGLSTCINTRCRSFSGRIGWHHHAMVFHLTNLTEGWDRAVEYLSSLTKPK